MGEPLEPGSVPAIKEAIRLITGAEPRLKSYGRARVMLWSLRATDDESLDEACQNLAEWLKENADG